MKFPKVSIIIPLYVIEDRFFKDLKKLDKLNYPNFEILVVCDKKIKLPKLKSDLRLILTQSSKTGPAEKRDIAIKKSKGKICAFIDDDAYPHENWLSEAIIHFVHPNIAAVGGPGLTPKEDTYWEQITGLVYSSFFCGGHAQYRFVQGKMQFVDDYPAYNLIVKKHVLQKVGGYGNHFYGGEDTFLCLKIIEAGYKILYDPNVMVYHHRRKLGIPYFNQIANIGKHRGYFFKKYPQTSRRPFYIIPSTLCIGLIVSTFITILYPQIFLFVYLLAIFVSFGLIILSLLKYSSNPLSVVLASCGVIATHLVYGMSFFQGLLVKKMVR